MLMTMSWERPRFTALLQQKNVALVITYPDFASVRGSGQLGAAVVSDVTGRQELSSFKDNNIYFGK